MVKIASLLIEAEDALGVQFWSQSSDSNVYAKSSLE